MNGRLIVILFATMTVGTALPAVAFSSDLPMSIAGIMSNGRVIAGGAALTSGPWGTDYITVSHALGVGSRYAILLNSEPPADATPVAACSSRVQGIDVLILRVPSHKSLPVIEWGDPAELRAGDELMVHVRKEFHPAPVKVKFLHINLMKWTGDTADRWPVAWHNVMVGQGYATHGFSGSPWVRNGRVFGLLKGAVRPPTHTTWFAVAETATQARQCLNDLRYEELIPKGDSAALPGEASPSPPKTAP